MENNTYVVVIGAANIDIQGFSYKKLIMKDSNPGKIKVSSGGVGRNIAENLSKLHVNVKLLTAFGDDPYSVKLINECNVFGIDVSHSIITSGMSSPTYLSILDDNGDMKLALCDAQILETISLNFIKDNYSLIENAELVVVDTNISQEVLEFISITFKHKHIFIDTVSTQKARKIKNIIGNFDTIKFNLLEATSLSPYEENDIQDLRMLSNYFVKEGVKNVFITLGKDGVHYGNIDYSYTLPSPRIDVVNATGAGDAFMAGLIYSRLNNFEINFTSKFSMAAAILALSHENTINPNMCVENINNTLNNLIEDTDITQCYI